MSGILKKILLGLGALILLLIVAVGALFIFIDPNDYRDELSQMAYKATGYKIDFKGEIKLKLIPSLAFSIKDVSVAQPEGFGTAHMAQVNELELQMALFPLLKKKVEVDAIVLNGLAVNIIKDAKGRYNFESGAEAKASAPASTSTQGQTQGAKPAESPVAGSTPAAPVAADADARMQALLQSHISSVSINNCVLNYDDKAAKQLMQLSLNKLELGNVGLNRDISCMLDISADMGKGQKASFTMNGEARYELAEKLLKLTIKSFKAGAEAPEMLAGKQELGGSLTALVNVGSGAVDLKTLLESAFLNGNVDVAIAGGAVSGAANLKAKPPVLVKALSPAMQKSLGLPAGLMATDGPLRSLDTRLAFKLAGDNLTLSNFSLLLGDKLAEASAKQIALRLAPAGPLLPIHSVKGDISLAAKPRPLMNALAISLETADPKVLSAFNSSFNFAVDNSSLKITALKGALDETSITGLVELLLPGAKGIPKGASSFAKVNLQLDAINLDRYLPPASDAAKPEPAKQPEKGSTPKSSQPPLKGSGLEKARAEITAGIKSLTVMKAPIKDISLNCVLANGVFTVNKAALKSFDGQLNASAALNLVNAQGQNSFKLSLVGLDIGKALVTVMDEKRLGGQAGGNIDLSFKGLDSDSILRSLNGNGKLMVKNGILRDFQLIPADAPAQLLKHRLSDYSFSDLSGSFKVVNGKLTNDDLGYKDKNMSLSGKGSVALVDRSIDYKGIIKTKETGEIPLRIQGPLSGPKISLDQEALARMAAEKGKEALVKELQKKGALPKGETQEERRQETQKQINEKVGKELQRGLEKLIKR